MNVMDKKPIWIMIFGFVLVTTGMVLPYLMIIRVISSGYLLNFLSFAASVAGLFMGVIGASMLVKIKRNDRHDK
jgi:hypothetical protein